MSSCALVSAIPVLLSANIPETIVFFESKLGFRCRYHQEGMAIFVRDSIEIMYTYCPNQECIDWSCCRVRVDNIDALHAELTRLVPEHPNGPLRDTDYGTREFALLDCHGALLTFFQKPAPSFTS
jgi:hypothetical protein